MTAALDASAAGMARPAVTAPRVLVVLCGFTALTILFFWPWISHLSSALIGPPEDNMQDFWNSWHAANASGWHDFLFTDQIRYPQGTSLSYHSFAWPQVFAVALLSRIFGADFTTLVALHNLTLLASFPLAATAMFFLARHLLGEVEGRAAGAVLAGFIFAFNPWHVAQTMHHAHVSGIEFLPLFALFYLKALEQRSVRLLAAASAMAALSALSCWYFLFYLFYFMAFQLLYKRIRDGRWSSGWALTAPILCLGAAVLLLSPWLVHMIGAPARTYPGNNIFVADPLAMIAFPPTHLLVRYGAGIYAALTGNAWENTIYLGLINLAVLGWALTRKSDKRLIHYALGGMAFFAIIAAGELLHVGGHITRLPLPGVVLANLPFFGNARTPDRAMVMVYLFLSLGLAQACVMALTYRGAVARTVMALTAIFMVLDFTPASLAATPMACPASLDVIAGDPDHVGVLDLPRGYVEGNAAMMLSACHGHPIVAGETARKMGDSLEDRLVTTDLAAQRRQLAAAHVKYIVLHRPQGELYRWNKADGRLADYVSFYRPLRDDGRLLVLGVY